MVCPLTGVADDPGLPPHTRLDEEIAFFGPVTAHFAIGHAQTVGSDPCSLCEDVMQVVSAKSIAAELRKCRLLGE